MKNILYQIVIEEHKHLLKKTGVYKILNKENNKVYIGSTSQRFSNRLSNHIRELIEDRHHSKYLQNSYNKRKDINKFEISILDVCEPEECLLFEQKWLDIYKSYIKEFGYNICPIAGSCLGIKKSKEEKIKIFERSRCLSDNQIIEIFKLRNDLKLSYRLISEGMNITKNQVASILTKPIKYKYVKEKYKLELKVRFEKEFTKYDIIKIHNLYEIEKFSIRDISEIMKLSLIKLKHLIYNEKLYLIEKENLKFNVEKNRKNKIYKRKKRPFGIKVNKTIISELEISEVFNLKYNSNLKNDEILEKTGITLKDIKLILSYIYQRRKYNQLYISLKTQFNLREKRTVLSEVDIVGIFNDYNSGKYLIEELNEKYNFNDVGVIIQKSDRISNYYKDIINKNNLRVDKSSTKNKEIKSKSMSEMNKKRAKTYEIVNPEGIKTKITNLAEFSRDNGLDAANLSRVSKNGKSYKGWKCICLD
jgi:group I intron endonuclease